jgi:hypothetical protein
MAIKTAHLMPGRSRGGYIVMWPPTIEEANKGLDIVNK